MKFEEAFATGDEGRVNTVALTTFAFANAIRRKNSGGKAGGVETGNHFEAVGIGRGETEIADANRAMWSFISNLEGRDGSELVKVVNMPKQREISGGICLSAAIHMGTDITISRDLMNTKIGIEGGTALLGST
jgi:hypothetical protein